MKAELFHSMCCREHQWKNGRWRDLGTRLGSVSASQSVFHSQCFTVSVSRSAFHGQHFTVSVSRSAFHGQRFTVSVSQSVFHSQRFTVSAVVCAHIFYEWTTIHHHL